MTPEIRTVCGTIADLRIPVITAAGNSGTDLDYSSAQYFPVHCGASNLIVIAGLQGNLLAPFSNFGLSSALTAVPASHIPTIDRNGNSVTHSGTSVAASLAAGAVGLALSHRPQVSLYDLKEAVIAGVNPLLDLQGRVTSGGSLNVFKMLDFLK